MVSIKKLAVLAFSVATATAEGHLDIQFRRFGQVGCNEDTHIRKDTFLHDPHCKSFDPHESAFYSFRPSAHSSEHDLQTKDCWITVYDQADCAGNASNFTIWEKDSLGECLQPTIPGRSVLLTCRDKAVSEPTHYQENDHYVTVTATPTPSPDTTTLMLQPYSTRSCHCDWY